MHTQDLTYTSHGGMHNRVPVIVGADVKAVTAASEALFEAHVAFVAINRERAAAQGDPVRYAEDARLAAAEAGQKGGDAGEAKKLKKKARAAEERLGDLDLEWEVAIANLQAKRFAYSAAVEHHAPALAAEARTAADAAVLSLASAAGIARKAETQLSGSLAILAALGHVRAGGEFAPVPPTARSGGMGGAPGLYVAEAQSNLNTAIGYATEILDDLKADEKAAAQAAKAEAEGDDDSLDDLGDEDEDDEVEA
ncbi:hypothetical protein [uncultured Microbacterium sp.]|uniref:hypothetical protein n=1 Tax=uncultured Microbacterium sp. TaxID=191216 RepID=UPI0028EFF1A8|nr:hypothetical protein [uncultured Microbacterium sp.]